MADIYDKLNSFLDANSPELAYFLHHTWNNQARAVTYKELRTAIQNGELDMKYLFQWQQDYSQFVVDHYAPVAQAAIEASTAELVGRYSQLQDNVPPLIDRFIQSRGGRLIREVSEAQYSAVNTLVRQAALSDTMTVDQLARAIRPTIGLTTRQSLSVKHYYDDLIEQGIDPQTAAKKEALYAERWHRRRAATIAQTELAYAYNNGEMELMLESVANGQILPGVKKKWNTAADERVCKECGPLDHMELDLDAPFPIGVQNPPAHPLCRCVITFTHVRSAASAPQPGQSQQPLQPPQPQFDLQGTGNDPKLTGDYHDCYLPQATRGKLAQIDAIPDYEHASDFMMENYGIRMPIDQYNKSPMGVQPCRQLVTAIDNLQETFGDDALIKMDSVFPIYGDIIGGPADYKYFHLGQLDSDAQNLHIAREGFDNQSLYKQLSRCFIDSQAREGEDATTVAMRWMDSLGLSYKDGDSAVDDLADLMARGFAYGDSDGLDAIKKLRKLNEHTIEQFDLGHALDRATPGQRRRINALLDRAPENIKKMLRKFGPNFNATCDQPPGKGAFQLSGTVFLTQLNGYRGAEAIAHTQYETFFHEHGHQIDFQNGYISYSWRNKSGDTIGDIIYDSCHSFADEVYCMDPGNGYMEWFEANTVKRGSALSFVTQTMGDWCYYKHGASIRSEFRLYSEKGRDAVKNPAIRAMFDDYCNLKETPSGGVSKAELRKFWLRHFNEFKDINIDDVPIKSKIEGAIQYVTGGNLPGYNFSDISDMFEEYSCVHMCKDYPFGAGHGWDYWIQDPVRLTSEFFAEMTSASVTNPRSLAAIKRFFPKAYDAYLQILEDIT